jgi:hypothetical protein
VKGDFDVGHSFQVAPDLSFGNPYRWPTEGSPVSSAQSDLEQAPAFAAEDCGSHDRNG